VISPKQGPLPDTTQHSQQTDFLVFGGIQTRNTSRRMAADPSLRPRGHLYWLEGLLPCYVLGPELGGANVAARQKFALTSRSYN
jgi:hypothetical protein